MPGWTNWREYQSAVAEAFRSLGHAVEVEASLEGARGKHNIDVHVRFRQHGVEINWIVECKLWNRPVEKANIIELQGIVADLGADRGFLFSEAGFQSGADKMTRASNITLVTSLSEFLATATATESPPQRRLLETHQDDGGPPVFLFPGPRARPQHLIRDGDLIVVGNWETGNISFVCSVDKTIESVVNLDRYESFLNREKTREIRVHPPGHLAIANGKLFLGQVFSDNIMVIDLATRSIVKRIQVPGGGEGVLAASPDNRTIYFASNKSSTLFVIDSVTYETFAYSYPSGGRGSMSIACSADGAQVLVGIQRGYASSVAHLPPGGCFLAVFDCEQRKFTQMIPLYEAEHGRADSSTPAYILPDPTSDRVYVGLFQGRPGIRLLGGTPLSVIQSSRSEINRHNRHFEWADPLALQFYRDDLLAIYRNNLELVLLDRETLTVKDRCYLGTAPNGPRDLLVLDDLAVITYPEKGGLLFIDLAAPETWR